MSSTKDARRADLIIPYQEPPPQTDVADLSSVFASTFPMAALMLRNKFIAWPAFVFTVQNWLGQGEDARRTSNSPAWLSALISLVALVATYLPVFLPPQSLRQGTSTEPPMPVPPLI